MDSQITGLCETELVPEPAPHGRQLAISCRVKVLTRVFVQYDEQIETMEARVKAAGGRVPKGVLLALDKGGRSACARPVE